MPRQQRPARRCFNLNLNIGSFLQYKSSHTNTAVGDGGTIEREHKRLASGIVYRAPSSGHLADLSQIRVVNIAGTSATQRHGAGRAALYRRDGGVGPGAGAGEDGSITRPILGIRV